MPGFDRDQTASLRHALQHLEANKIDREDGSGWYSGSKSAFIARHRKAIALLRALIGHKIPPG